MCQERTWVMGVMALDTVRDHGGRSGLVEDLLEGQP